MNLGLSVKDKGVSRILNLVKDVEAGREKLLYRTLSATQSKMKVEASKKIRTQLALKKAYVDERLKVGKVSYQNLTARLTANKRGILMTRFAYRRNRKKNGGYDVKIKPKGGYKNLPGAFLLPRLKNSGVSGLAIRKGKKLKVLHAPSVSQVLSTFLPELKDEMSAFAQERLRKEVSSIIRRGR